MNHFMIYYIPPATAEIKAFMVLPVDNLNWNR